MVLLVLLLQFGLVFICNSLLLGFGIYYACLLFISHLTLSQVQRPSQFVFKLLLCGFMVSSATTVCYWMVYFTSYLSTFIRIVGEELLKTEICFSNLITCINLRFPLVSESFNLFSFDGIIRSLVSVGFINLTLSYALRYIMIQVFSIISPFAILCLAIDNFKWIFKAWLKIFLSLLFLQILVSFILLIAFSLSILEQNSFSSLLYLGAVYALIKANSFIRDFMGGLSTDITSGFSSIKSIFFRNN